jgi:hypothetical protein
MYQNIQKMYEEVYTHLVTAGLVVKHSDAIWQNEAGDVVPYGKDGFGCESSYELKYPEWLAFMDEVGSNTSQAKYGNVGGQTYLCTKDGHPQNWAATKDTHFTLLGFTAANGEPLICTIIFTAKTLKDQWKVAFDPFVEWIGEED